MRRNRFAVVTLGDMYMSLYVQLWDIQQLQRVGLPLGEQVVHFGLTVVVARPTGVVRRPHADAEIVSVIEALLLMAAKAESGFGHGGH